LKGDDSHRKTEGCEKGLKEVEEAIEDYVDRKASLGGAAETAGMPRCGFREELREREGYHPRERSL